ncbi:MAG: hypothetical protein A3H49_09505 [Nitrospirae bacterium RIFCSPLOWO2_02_FULL_62_14]|nr:MAG: hypothetical protein A3H49_09505 [Nitrospirae bacterium RIFCSPLOWO2_02_FULL_62_14]OGW69477.1 MAG: hypothetical protein A3A88_03780 [Nitrospirae bacterium RIFCSPLOWO2_01_FULL_62_17]OGX13943.1 MAG: hypothetical protein A3K11_06885 [Nitrospirae bacterium RIFCSPLOWO2_12_FULL_63_8]
MARHAAAPILLTIILAAPGAVEALDWVPTEEEIQKYRKSWNPLSHGPMLISSPDIQPKGQWYIRPLIFAQIGTSSFGNQLEFATGAKGGPVHLYSAQLPFVQTAYGLNDHWEVGAQTALNTFWARENGQSTSEVGWGDTSFSLKYRPVVQDPYTWVPSINWFNQIAFPTSKWADTDKPPGGFSPIGRFPSTRSGEISMTTGIAFRKNLQPYRWSGGVYYTYSAPGLRDKLGQTTYAGDLINTRLVFEHILSDKHGFGYNLEFVSLHGLTHRIDGHRLNSGQKDGFSVFGVEPAVQWRFGDSNFLAAGGVLFTIAGQNATNSMYPNFSIFYYWSKSGKVLMR